jgi:hypothetical protein
MQILDELLRDFGMPRREGEGRTRSINNLD